MSKWFNSLVKPHLFLIVTAMVGALLSVHGWWVWQEEREYAHERDRTYQEVLAAVRDLDDEKVVERAMAFLGQHPRGAEEKARCAQVTTFLDESILRQVLRLSQSGKRSDADALLKRYQKVSN